MIHSYVLHTSFLNSIFVNLIRSMEHTSSQWKPEDPCYPWNNILSLIIGIKWEVDSSTLVYLCINLTRWSVTVVLRVLVGLWEFAHWKSTNWYLYSLEVLPTASYHKMLLIIMGEIAILQCRKLADSILIKWSNLDHR